MSKLLRSTSLTVIMRGLTLVANILSVTIVAPYLGPESYGVLAVVISLTAWTPLINLGMIEGLVPVLTKSSMNPHRDSSGVRYLASAFKCNLVLSTFIFCITALGLYTAFDLGKIDLTTALSYLAACGLYVLATPFTLVNSIYLSSGRIHHLTAWALAQSACYLALLAFSAHVLPIPSGWEILVASFAFGISAFLTRALNFLTEFARLRAKAKTRPKTKVRLLDHRTKFLFKFSYPHIILGIAAIMAFQTDRIIALRVLSAQDVAVLDVAMKAFSAFYTLYFICIGSLWNLIGKPWNQGELGTVRKNIKQALAIAGVFWTFLSISAPLILPLLIQVWTRNTITIADNSLLIFIAVLFSLRGIVDIFTISLFAMKKQHATMSVVITHGALNLILAYVGGTHFGLKGIVGGQILSLLFTSGLAFPYMVRSLIRQRGSHA